MVKNSKGKSGYRSFTVTDAVHKDGCPTKFSSKGKGGNFHQKNPYGAVKKAFNSLCRRKHIVGRCSLFLKIRETTQGSKHKEYRYKLVRSKKKTPGPFGNLFDVSATAVKKLPKEKCKKSYKSRGRMVKRSVKSKAHQRYIKYSQKKTQKNSSRKSKSRRSRK